MWVYSIGVKLQTGVTAADWFPQEQISFNLLQFRWLLDAVTDSRLGSNIVWRNPECMIFKQNHLNDAMNQSRVYNKMKCWTEPCFSWNLCWSPHYSRVWRPVYCPRCYYTRGHTLHLQALRIGRVQKALHGVWSLSLRQMWKHHS